MTELGGPQTFQGGDGGRCVDECGGPGGAGRVHPQSGAAVSGGFRSAATAEDVETRLKTIREALQETPAVEKQLGAVADSIERGIGRFCGRCAAMWRWQSGASRCRLRSTTGSSRSWKASASRWPSRRSRTWTPTTLRRREFADQLARLRALVEVDLAKLEKDMEAAGAPWTPGRVPEWSEK